jgi:hypothetical protein
LCPRCGAASCAGEPQNKISPRLHTVNLLYRPYLGNFFYALFTFLVCAWSREPQTGKLQQQIWTEKVVDHTVFLPAVFKARYVYVQHIKLTWNLLAMTS